MALETPNQTAAAAVVLVQDASTVPVFEFRSVAGFQSVGLVDAVAPMGGYQLELTNPVTNDEGLCYVGGDPGAGMEEEAVVFITPSHIQTGIAAVDALPANRVAILDYFPDQEAFRFWVHVMTIHTEIAPIAGEPLAP